MHIFKEKAKVISKEPIWCCVHENYLYTAPTLLKLLTIINTEWEQDKWLGY